MSVCQTNYIRLYLHDKGSKNKIREFVEKYNKLYLDSFGESHIFLGGFPIYKMDYPEYSVENDEYCVVYVHSKSAWVWGGTASFFSPFLDSGICSKIVWCVYQDNGINTIYLNEETGGNACNEWHKYVFNSDAKGLSDFSLEC